MTSIAIQDTPTLLLVLEASVQEDPSPPGFKGAVSIGVAQDEQTVWWHADFEAASKSTTLSITPPVDGRARLLLGAAEANSIVNSGQLPEKVDTLVGEGDMKLVERVVNRYTGRRQGAVDVRSRGAKW